MRNCKHTIPDYNLSRNIDDVNEYFIGGSKSILIKLMALPLALISGIEGLIIDIAEAREGVTQIYKLDKKEYSYYRRSMNSVIAKRSDFLV